MRTNWIACLATLSLQLQGAITNLQQVGATSTSIIVSYTKYSPSVTCRVRASKLADFSTVVPDTDAALYAGSDADNRYGNVQVATQVTARIGWQGARAIEKASDGYTRSRALEAHSSYYVRVDNCGDGDVQTITARTANIPLGISRGESLAVDPNVPFTYKQVSTNRVRVPDFADPYTGTRIVQSAPFAGFAYGVTSANSAVSGCNITMSPTVKGGCRFVEASGNNWSATTGTLTDAIQSDDNNYLTYSATGQDKLFLRYGGSSRFPASTTYGNVLASLNVGLRALTSDASGDGANIRSCLTYDGNLGNNATCASPALRVTATATEATYAICDDSPCTVPDKPGHYSGS